MIRIIKIWLVLRQYEAIMKRCRTAGFDTLNRHCFFPHLTPMLICHYHFHLKFMTLPDLSSSHICGENKKRLQCGSIRHSELSAQMCLEMV